ncbi:hypothetical protein F1559_001329 [Cyanidiococcus yangmingshanensis]|uniref:SWIM-type domain-containing protein n=1 Tax=Cyanidiococcus yangmingshanensis TaxID=2690220 RepID=A0A7J7IEE5_9RHOD|nr:hypothetical protein F1559_001329 [Cyanidiococcus yangmingshanensis]
MEATTLVVSEAPALVAEQWSDTLFVELLREVQAQKGTLRNDQLVALYVLSGGNASVIDAALELAANESSRITVQSVDSLWFALVKRSRPTSGRPYVCCSDPPRCSCGRSGAPFCKHLLAAALIQAAGEDASEAQWIQFPDETAWREALQTATEETENWPHSSYHEAGRTPMSNVR